MSKPKVKVQPPKFVTINFPKIVPTDIKSLKTLLTGDTTNLNTININISREIKSSELYKLIATILLEKNTSYLKNLNLINLVENNKNRFLLNMNYDEDECIKLILNNKKVKLQIASSGEGDYKNLNQLTNLSLITLSKIIQFMPTSEINKLQITSIKFIQPENTSLANISSLNALNLNSLNANSVNLNSLNASSFNANALNLNSLGDNFTNVTNLLTTITQQIKTLFLSDYESGITISSEYLLAFDLSNFINVETIYMAGRNDKRITLDVFYKFFNFAKELKNKNKDKTISINLENNNMAEIIINNRKNMPQDQFSKLEYDIITSPIQLILYNNNIENSAEINRFYHVASQNLNIEFMPRFRDFIPPPTDKDVYISNIKAVKIFNSIFAIYLQENEINKLILVEYGTGTAKSIILENSTNDIFEDLKNKNIIMVWYNESVFELLPLSNNYGTDEKYNFKYKIELRDIQEDSQVVDSFANTNNSIIYIIIVILILILVLVLLLVNNRPKQ